jgi:murein DD-endopeptidase MepM/ murein hydrolase activator NlpD
VQLRSLVYGCLIVALNICVSCVLARAPSSSRVVDEGGFSDEMSVKQRAAIENELASNRTKLVRMGKISEDTALTASVTGNLQWPLQPTAAFIGFSYHGVSNFVDHDLRAPGHVQDYTCGTRTYDSADGSNHAGTDYFITPFPWLMMDQEQVTIVAAAPGTIIGKSDGNFDRDCAIDFAKQWNAVYVQHADRSVAWYGHMKSGTVTSKPIGATVEAGETLGFVGSSGASSGPHLHFELHDSSGAIVDPRHGQCNTSAELWSVFQPYEDPKINSLSTHSQAPDFVDCGVDASGHTATDDPHYSDTFVVGDTVQILASYSDQRDGESTHFEIVAPDGSIADSWDFDLSESQLPKPFYAATFFSWTYVLASDARAGTWRIKATFQDQTFAHDFTVQGTAPIFNLEAAARARRQMGSNATRCRPAEGQLASSCSP